MGPSILLQGLALSLNRVSILQPIDGTFAAGKLHAIVGPNGAGKSSLLKCVLGLQPHSGDVFREWAEAPGPVAYVPQQSQFEPSLPITINEFLLATFSRRPLWLPMKSAAKVRIDQLLAQVGLTGKGHLRLGQLSGGERQRLLLAQGLDQGSQLWCLDEPMTGLDQEGQEMVNRLLLQLRRQGATLLVVHHDMTWVKRYADWVWVIDGGLAAVGTPDEVFADDQLEVA
ncbi:metal ABC transporter ATP-binding protein [Aeromonas allosaccharophila]|uniref:Metal ABC transporter ATP-binding protein n=1 Tax=Aeromonas allosaccharophila TaxID=656 RepID=A0AAX3NVL4_9GAMM|nr:metal ABC transporter ATP-binding protein [Aeromonas allosaccharophila]WED78191.1 metal ABC transporter ATP-binding protein [Aeromonas allosaccharophila]